MYVVGKKDGTFGKVFHCLKKLREREREKQINFSVSPLFTLMVLSKQNPHIVKAIDNSLHVAKEKSHVLLILMSHVSNKANSFSYPLATEHLCRRRTQEGNGIRQCGSLEACYREGKGGESQPGGWEMAMRDWHLCTFLSSAN